MMKKLVNWYKEDKVSAIAIIIGVVITIVVIVGVLLLCKYFGGYGMSSEEIVRTNVRTVTYNSTGVILP